MNSSSRLLRARPTPPCQLCDFILRQPAGQRRSLSSALIAESSRPPSRSQLLQRLRLLSRKAPPSYASPSATSRFIRSASTGQGSNSPLTANAAVELEKAQQAILAILNNRAVPSEEVLLAALKVSQDAAEQLIGHGSKSELATSAVKQSTPTSVLLDFKSHSVDPTKPIELLSTLLYKLMKHPPVFISPKVLGAYITTQTLLERPESFPEVLYLYGNKPIATPDTFPVKYSLPNPSNPSAAVPSDIANRAIDAAIKTKDLQLALSIIELTFRQPAYRRAFLIRKVMPPVLGLGLAPGAAYVLASKFAEFQQVANPQSAVQIAMVGILAYVGVVSTIGVVAVTTANDQMDRISWAMGMALSERYLREEERAAVDRVAQAWGFKDVNRKGEEEGEEWDELREWAGLRGMVLDKVDLMEGMQ